MIPLTEEKPSVLIRADGSHALGMGHIYRALNLADALTSWAKVRFITRGDEIAYVKLAERYPTDITRNDDEDYEKICASPLDAIVVDKLNNNASYMRRLKSQCRVLVSFDDCGEGVKEADIAFNVLYHCEKTVKTGSTRVYNEPSYAIINPQFSETRRVKQKTLFKILVTLGGADTLGLTPGVIETLDALSEEFQMTAVIGTAFKHHSELEKAVARCKHKIDVRFNVPDMWNAMTEANLAISAGGNTLFELAATGTPAIVLCEELFEVETADRMMKEGTCENLGYSKPFDEQRLRQTTLNMIKDSKRRQKMSEVGRRLVDGRGSERVSIIIRTF